jgi:hypothetical protein
MESIVKHGSEKRSLEPITCGKESSKDTTVEEGKGGRKGKRWNRRRRKRSGAG